MKSETSYYPATSYKMENNTEKISTDKISVVDENDENKTDRKLSAIVTASMAVQKLQNDQKRIQEFKNNITIMRKDSQKVDLHIASEKGDYDKVKLLLSKEFTPNDKNALSKTPLHLACKSLSPKVITLLIESGADVNAQDSTMMTPLHHLLLISGRLKEQVEKVTECINLLIAHKANVNLSDYAGNTALHLAAMRAEDSWVDALIGAGADMNAKNKEGVSVLYFIMKHCPKSLTKCLDNCVKLNDKKGISSQSVGFEVRLDFNTLDLRKHYRKENEIITKKRQLRTFENTTDPTIFFSQVLGIRRNNDQSLNHIIEDIFMHPVSQTYFYLKWKEISWLYYIVVLFTHFLYSITYSAYAVLVYRTICKTTLIQEDPTDGLSDIYKNTTCRYVITIYQFFATLLFYVLFNCNASVYLYI